MKENFRKCIMCGSSSSQDASITLHRFPKPGRTNSLRCELWAKYCFPNEAWSSPEFQGKLYSQHKMLCSKHFLKTCFIDQKLFRTAVPSEEFDEVLKCCFDSGLNIAATVCDLDSVNKRAITILGATVEQPYIKLGNHEIVTIFDTPHLLKCFRNLFLKYDIKCQTNITSNNICGIGIAKWSYIKEFYELDNSNPNFVFAPLLKPDHLNPNTKQKMSVKLAAQVLSHSVAAGMYAKIAKGELSCDAITTANVIANMDKLFDSVNANTPDLRRGKTMSTNLKDNTNHIHLFKEMKDFFCNSTFLGCNSSPPSKEGWDWKDYGITLKKNTKQ